MPFTPFHAGPGAAIKAAIPRQFSFTVFCFAQVVTDFETAYHMIRHEFPLHRWMHTYAGATLVAVFCVIVGRPLCQLVLRAWMRWREAPFQQFFPASNRISWMSAITGAFIGTYSHVFLDSITHRDVEPFRPFRFGNPFYSELGAFAVHISCIILGLLGLWYIANHSTKSE
jgi:hypothetical protein